MPVLRYWDPTQGAYVSLSGTGPQGPPAAASSPLAYVKYAPASLVAYAITTTLTALDTTNLTISFHAPQSGSVIIKASIYTRGFAATTLGQESMVMLGFVTHGTSTQVTPLQRFQDASNVPASSYIGTQCYYESTVSGLTPGANYQWDLAACYYVTSGTASASCYVDSGGGNGTVGPAIMGVYDSAGVGAQGPQGPQGAQGPATLPWGFNGLNGNMTCAASTNYGVTASSLVAGMWLVLAQALFVPSAAGAFTFWIGTAQASSSGVLVPYEVTVPSGGTSQAYMVSFWALTNQSAAWTAWLNHYGAGCQIRSSTSNYALPNVTSLTSLKVG
jgi:hypothetical protein